MTQRWDIAIVGGGAAGLMAGIFAGRAAQAARGLAATTDGHSPSTSQPLRIGILDSAPRLGAKILVAGGGRCNVTNERVTPKDFNGGSRNAIKRVLASLNVPDTIAFFQEIGVDLKAEPLGKLFPTTDRARTVLDALLNAAKDVGVEIVNSCRVESIARQAAAGDIPFTLTTSIGEHHAAQVILATGGKSLPKTGSDGHGLQLARSLGHTLSDTTPALAPLVLPGDHYLTRLQGIAADVTLNVQSATGKRLAQQDGAMLLTHFGLSGPVVLDISRHWVAARKDDPGALLSADFTNGLSFEAIDAKLVEVTTQRRRASLVNAVREMLNAETGQLLSERLVRAVVEHATDGSTAPAIDPAAAAGSLSRDARRRLAHALTGLPLPVTRDRGYKFAEVTAGGVTLSEVDPKTMASRVCDGLYLCGEMLDVDGRIGGFNFQWAWCSGRLAGMAAAAEGRWVDG